MDYCLAEACRVLNDHDGLIYVGEDETSGSFDDMVRMIDDHSVERAWTMDALDRMPSDFFAAAREIHYRLKRQFSGFDAFAGALLGKPAITTEMINDEIVKALFEQGRKGNIFEFDQARRVNLYRTGNVSPAGA